MKPPEHWDDVPKMGGCIPVGTHPGSTAQIVCARVPLDEKYCVAQRHVWTPFDLLETCFEQKQSVHMVIDLTNTFKYYDGQREFHERNVEYVKMKVEGFADVPSESIVRRFIKVLTEWDKCLIAENHKSDYAPVAVVHCTHGLNRTGYLVVRYLIEAKGLSVKEALAEFAAARPPGLIKHMYVTKLYEMFSQTHELELPVLPAWAQKKYDRSQAQLARADKFARTEDDSAPDAGKKKRQRERKRFPDHWTEVAPMGNVVAGTNFLPLRTPLDVADKEPHIWRPADFIAAQAAAGHDVRLAIDLSDADEHYEHYEQLPDGLAREKLVLEGRDGCPSPRDVDTFLAMVATFEETSVGHIAVHSALGLNRTGFLIVCYLVRVKRVPLAQALEAFAVARPPGIFRPACIDALHALFAPESPKVYPELPAWATSRSRRKHDKEAEGPRLAEHPPSWDDLPTMGAPIVAETAAGFVHLLPMKTLLDDRFVGGHSWGPADFAAFHAAAPVDAVVCVDDRGQFYEPTALPVPYFNLRVRSRHVPREDEVALFVAFVAETMAAKAEGPVRIVVHCTVGSRSAYLILHYLTRQAGMQLDDALAKYQAAYPPGPIVKAMLNRLQFVSKRSSPDVAAADVASLDLRTDGVDNDGKE
ncbi:hypothetical protein ACHHYP_04185 [Achlya hypogyna]|uniref:protein-tyrosine-phosphatase n=1 Tax=Achlya hypogyna TaxID=1202772 RepID=A0A1V9Z224_ACHHY|nr:hypothetical protein ACHHYP_04185 [Achlya hypogyna]